jgi:hypothetical protein
LGENEIAFNLYLLMKEAKELKYKIFTWVDEALGYYEI